MSPSISAAIIVRNEEAFLGDCLSSIRRDIDEIVIVDTGSTDSTVQIARRFGARVLEQPWADDFSAARNTALEHATRDWILYIDADERLTTPLGSTLRTCRLEDVVACRVLLRPRTGFTSYYELRLFRRDPRIRFRGIIHETVHPAIGSVCQSDGLRVLDTDIGLDHVGYDGDLVAKYRRNLPLLERAVGATPERVFLWVDLAHALAGIGRSGEAERAAWRAVELAAAATDGKQHNDGAAAWLHLIGLHLEQNPQRSLDLAERASAIYPHNHALALALANARFHTGGADEILPILDSLTQIDPASLVDPLNAYDVRIFGEWLFDLMGAVHARMGRRAEAARAFRRASELAPGNSSYRMKAVAFAAAVPR